MRHLHRSLSISVAVLGLCSQAVSMIDPAAEVVQQSGPPPATAHEHAHRAGSSDSSVDSAVAVRAALSHTSYNQASPDPLFLKIDLEGAKGTGAEQRRPLNLCLLIDRSGSMADERKFEYALQAAAVVIENLSELDVVSIVAFSIDALVLSPAGPVVNREFLDHRLREITPDGGTNLSAGLLEAFAQVDAGAKDGQTQRVILLTDGLANRGITDPTHLGFLVRSARERGIGVSTMGCGDEFDETLLTDLSTAGGGRYTYIRSPEQIPGAMAAELDGLLRILAQNVTVEVVVNGLEIVRVHERPLDNPTGSFTFDLGDVREGDHGVLILGLTPRDFAPGAVALVDCRVTLDRVDVGKHDHRELHLEAAMAVDGAEVVDGVDQGVLHYGEIVDAVERAEDAVLGMDADGLRRAFDLFDQHYVRVRRHAIEVRDQQLLNQAFILKHLMSELSEASERGLMHDHDEARLALRKEIDYRRYLRGHHRGRR